jgi:hypothetical protein
MIEQVRIKQYPHLPYPHLLTIYALHTSTCTIQSHTHPNIKVAPCPTKRPSDQEDSTPALYPENSELRFQPTSLITSLKFSFFSPAVSPSKSQLLQVRTQSIPSYLFQRARTQNFSHWGK